MFRRRRWVVEEEIGGGDRRRRWRIWVVEGSYTTPTIFISNASLSHV